VAALVGRDPVLLDDGDVAVASPTMPPPMTATSSTAE
jgi:hypothetical protein